MNLDEDYDVYSATKEENISNVLHEISETISHGRDLIFICGDGQHLPFHQALVTPHSQFLSELVDLQSCCSCKSRSCVNKNDIYISLPGVEPIIMASLMQCIYTGRCNSFDVEGTEKLSTLVSMLGFNIDIELFMAFSERQREIYFRGIKGNNKVLDEITLDEETNVEKDNTELIQNLEHVNEVNKENILNNLQIQLQSNGNHDSRNIKNNPGGSQKNGVVLNTNQSQTEAFTDEPEIVLVEPQSVVNKNDRKNLTQNEVIKSHNAINNPTERLKDTELFTREVMGNFFSSPEAILATNSLTQKVQKALNHTKLGHQPTNSSQSGTIGNTNAHDLKKNMSVSVITERKSSSIDAIEYQKAISLVEASVNMEAVQTTEVNHIDMEEVDLAPKKAKRNINPKKERIKSSLKENDSLITDKKSSNDNLQFTKIHILPEVEQLGYSCHYKTSTKNTNHVSKPAKYGYVKLQEICQFKSTRKDDLKLHLGSIHGDLVYSCYNFTCSYGASTKVELFMHMESIHNQTFYLCNYISCTFGIGTKVGLKKHFSSKHETPDEAVRAMYENKSKGAYLSKNMMAEIEENDLKNTSGVESRNILLATDKSSEDINNLYNMQEENLMVVRDGSKDSNGEDETSPNNLFSISNKEEKLQSLSVDQSEISEIDSFLDLMEDNASTFVEDGISQSSDNLAAIAKAGQKIGPILETEYKVVDDPIIIDDFEFEELTIKNIHDSSTTIKLDAPLESRQTDFEKEAIEQENNFEIDQKDSNRKRAPSEPAFKIKISKSNFIFNRISAENKITKSDVKVSETSNEKVIDHAFDTSVNNVALNKNDADKNIEKHDLEEKTNGINTLVNKLDKTDAILLKDKLTNKDTNLPAPKPDKLLDDPNENCENKDINKKESINEAISSQFDDSRHQSESLPNGIKTDDKKVHACNICAFKSLKLHHLTRHKMEKHDERRFSCSYCSNKFKRNEHLQKHMVICKKRDENKELSNESTASQLDDSDHQSEIPAKRIKIEDEKNVLACNICEFKTITLQYLNRHKKENHGERSYPCSFCSDKFKRKEHLQKHMVNCKKRDENKEKLSNESTDENKEKLSNESTPSQLEDSDHQSEIPAKRIKIEDEKNVLACNICEFKTSTSILLNRHKKEQHEERSYPCSFCSDKFKRKEHLQKHIVAKHGNVQN